MTELEIIDRPQALVGRLTEHRELQGLLVERPGLVVVEADPLSGTSGVLWHLINELGYPGVLIDARRASDALDLAMVLADTAVERLVPKAAAWWQRDSVPQDVEGLRLTRALSHLGVDLEDLRDGSGAGLDRLREALQLASAVAGGPVLIAIDHLDSLLETVGRRSADELLGVLRTERQAADAPNMLLVGRPQGPTAEALRAPEHPLYRAGQVFRIRRASPERFVRDLALARENADLTIGTAPIDLIGDAAALSQGVCGYVWQIVALAPSEGTSPSRASRGWEALKQLNTTQTARQFELLGSLHRAAPTLIAALSRGLRPYGGLPIADKSIHDALSRMRSRGIVWSPGKGRWRVADPLLLSWARVNGPPWITRTARRRPA